HRHAHPRNLHSFPTRRSSDLEDLRALREVVRVLVPGGVFLLESMHRDDVVASYGEKDAWMLPNGTRVEVRRRFDPVSGVSHEDLDRKSTRLNSSHVSISYAVF